MSSSSSLSALGTSGEVQRVAGGRDCLRLAGAPGQGYSHSPSVEIPVVPVTLSFGRIFEPLLATD